MRRLMGLFVAGRKTRRREGFAMGLNRTWVIWELWNLFIAAIVGVLSVRVREDEAAIFVVRRECLSGGLAGTQCYKTGYSRKTCN